MKRKKKISRRKFIQGTGAVLAAATAAPDPGLNRRLIDTSLGPTIRHSPANRVSRRVRHPHYPGMA